MVPTSGNGDEDEFELEDSDEEYPLSDEEENFPLSDEEDDFALSDEDEDYPLTTNLQNLAISTPQAVYPGLSGYGQVPQAFNPQAVTPSPGLSGYGQSGIPQLTPLVITPTIPGLPGAVSPNVIPPPLTPYVTSYAVPSVSPRSQIQPIGSITQGQAFNPQMYNPQVYNPLTVPAGQTLTLPITPVVAPTAWQQKVQKANIARQQINYPIQSLAMGQFQVTPNLAPIGVAGPVLGPGSMSQQTLITPQATPSFVMPAGTTLGAIPAAPIKGRGKKANYPVTPTVSQSYAAQTTGLPILQPSQIPYDPTKQEPGETNLVYQRRLGLYQALLAIRLNNGQTIPPETANVLAHMRNNVDIDAVGYNQAAMQLLQQYLPVNK